MSIWMFSGYKMIGPNLVVYIRLDMLCTQFDPLRSDMCRVDMDTVCPIHTLTLTDTFWKYD